MDEHGMCSVNAGLSLLLQDRALTWHQQTGDTC